MVNALMLFIIDFSYSHPVCITTLHPYGEQIVTNAILVLSLFMLSLVKSCKRLRIYTIVAFSFIRTFAP